MSRNWRVAMGVLSCRQSGEAMNCGHSSDRVVWVDCLEPTSKYDGWELKNWASWAVCSPHI